MSWEDEEFDKRIEELVIEDKKEKVEGDKKDVPSVVGSPERSPGTSMIEKEKEEKPTTAIINSLLLDHALLEAMRGGKRDRDLVLLMESDIFAFMNNERNTQLTFPYLTAKQRLLLHRLASRFELGHRVVGDETPEATRTIVIYKTGDSKMPSRSLTEDLRDIDSSALLTEPQPVIAPQKVMLMKRKNPTNETVTVTTIEKNTKTKDKEIASKLAEAELLGEEREKQYEAARARIFESEEPKENVAKSNYPKEAIKNYSSNITNSNITSNSSFSNSSHSTSVTTPLNKGIINSQTTIARGPPLLASSLDGGRGFVGKAIRGEVTTNASSFSTPLVKVKYRDEDSYDRKSSEFLSMAPDVDPDYDRSNYNRGASTNYGGGRGGYGGEYARGYARGAPRGYVPPYIPQYPPAYPPSPTPPGYSPSYNSPVYPSPPPSYGYNTSPGHYNSSPSPPPPSGYIPYRPQTQYYLHQGYPQTHNMRPAPSRGGNNYFHEEDFPSLGGRR